MLARIADVKRNEIKMLKQDLDPEQVLREHHRAKAINPQEVFNQSSGRVQVIAEIKKASPLKGTFMPALDPVDLALTYERNGACAVSLITDRQFFQGSEAFFQEVRPRINLPMLRKDFILDEIQLYQTLALEADLVLLIAALHDYERLLHLTEQSRDLGLCVLLEIHGREELNLVSDLPLDMVGINNRDLNDFTVRVTNSLELAPLLPGTVVKVSESGIKSPDDMLMLEAAGFQAVLVGEALVSSPDPGRMLASLVNYREVSRG